MELVYQWKNGPKFCQLVAPSFLKTSNFLKKRFKYKDKYLYLISGCGSRWSVQNAFGHPSSLHLFKITHPGAHRLGSNCPLGLVYWHAFSSNLSHTCLYCCLFDKTKSRWKIQCSRTRGAAWPSGSFWWRRVPWIHSAVSIFSNLSKLVQVELDLSKLKGQ